MAGPALRPLFHATDIADRLQDLAGAIAAAMPPDVVFVSILKGSFIFAADLVRALAGRDMNPAVDFMILSSYGSATRSSGTVHLLRDVGISLENRSVLLVDDILDSGRTLDFAKRHLLARGAREVRICVLLEKAPHAEGERCRADFAGFACPDAFVVGYGMDHDHKFRGLPYIAILCQ